MPTYLSRFALCLFLTLTACDSSDTTDDPGPGDNGDDSGLRCSAPDLADVAEGRFLIDYYNDGEPTEHTGDAVFGFVDHNGARYFVVHFPESDDLVFSVFGERDDLPAEGDFEIDALDQDPFVGWIESTESGFFTGSAPGELTFSTVTDDLAEGTFAFGSGTQDYGACGAFKATPSDSIDPAEVAGL